MNEARKLIKYLEGLTLTQGPRAGEKMRVLPWQKRFVRGFLAAQVSALTVGRGNGKTTLLAGIAAAALNGPLARPRGECLLVAGSFTQARTAFEHVLEFLPASEREKCRVNDTAQNAEIRRKDTGAMVKCHGATPRLIHSRAPALILADEPSSWLHTQSGAMVSGLLTGLGKIKDGRAVFLGTRPASADHFFEKMIQGTADFSACYACPRELWEGKPFTLEAIRAANPSLAHMPDLKTAIRKDGERAQKDEGLLPAYLALRLNAGVSDVAENLLLQAETWQRIEGDAEPAGETVWGIDLGSTAAQSAVAVFWPESGRLEVMAAFPRNPGLEYRGRSDGAGSLYVNCFKRGELITAGEYVSDVAELLLVALEKWGTPGRLVCDRWRLGDLREACGKANLTAAIEERGQGFKDGAEDVRHFRRACLDGEVMPTKSLLLRSAMSVARVVSDPAGNAKLAKAGEGKRVGARDDAAAAAILAVSSGVRTPPKPPVTDFVVW